ncbi:hypothetical protein ACLOJK_028253, partial [Asimina triloba]
MARGLLGVMERGVVAVLVGIGSVMEICWMEEMDGWIEPAESGEWWSDLMGDGSADGRRWVVDGRWLRIVGMVVVLHSKRQKWKML